MRVTNDGDIPLRITADARLLALDVTPRSAARALRCELPFDMRPGDDLETPLVLPPRRSYAESFEPRLYCFGGAKLGALAGGATVVLRLGWPQGNVNRPPYAVSPIDGVVPELAPLKTLDSLPIVLPDEPTASLSSAWPATPPEADVPRLALSPALSIDAETIEDIEIPVTLRNEGSRAVVTRFRPETLGFWVTGPTGVHDCSWPTVPGAPTDETFATLAGKEATTLNVLLSAYCTGHQLDQPGLFVVRPRLDTRRASGAPIGYRTFDGLVIATTPAVVRLHRGVAPPPLRRPHLEP
jgi:hypothetical protein